MFTQLHLSNPPKPQAPTAKDILGTRIQMLDKEQEQQEDRSEVQQKSKDQEIAILYPGMLRWLN